MVEANEAVDAALVAERAVDAALVAERAVDAERTMDACARC